jgi:hypothetical protein
MGHNVGCRHNFRGSYDSMNYFPDYWKLRTEALENPDAGMEPSDGKLHPRYVNKPGGALTQHEINGGVRDAMYSSIMDYGSEFHTDLMGLGLYDKAFMKFSYGKIVEVFTEAKSDRVSLSKISSLQEFQDALGFPSALGAASGLSAIPYQSYPSLFKGGTDEEEAGLANGPGPAPQAKPAAKQAAKAKAKPKTGVKHLEVSAEQETMREEARPDNESGRGGRGGRGRGGKGGRGGRRGGRSRGRGRAGDATAATGSGVGVQHGDTFSDGTVRLSAACQATDFGSMASTGRASAKSVNIDGSVRMTTLASKSHLSAFAYSSSSSSSSIERS